MGTIWFKEADLPGETHPITGGAMPFTLPPGIYCEDHATFAELRRAAWEREPAVEYDDLGASLGGIRVYVATPEQAAVLRAMAPKEATMDEVVARRAQYEAEVDAKVARLMKVLEGPIRTRDHFRNETLQEIKIHRHEGPPPDPNGNRKARRASAAMARKGVAVRASGFRPVDPDRLVVARGQARVSAHADFTADWMAARDAKLPPSYEAELRRYCEAAFLGEPYEPGPNVIADADLPAVRSFHG